mgnify:FL=1|jgi:hypothetical protein
MQSYRQASKDMWFGIDQSIKMNGKAKPVVKKNKGSLLRKPDDTQDYGSNETATQRYVMQIREAFKRNMG